MKHNASRHLQLFTLAGLTSIAAAQSRSILDITVSLDGVTWTNELTVDRPDRTVQVRATLTYERQDGDPTPIALASLTWQPTASNWLAADTLLPFADRGNNSNGGGVPDIAGSPAPYGRILPFAATGPTTSDPYRGHVQLVGGINYLRIARASITSWAGDGPTSGTAAANNFNGAGGLACVQKSVGNVNPSSDPAFRAGTTDVPIFKAAVQFHLAAAARTVVFDAPLSGMSRNSTTGEREASWYQSEADNFGSIKAGVIVDIATVHVLPNPGALAILAAATLTITARRRR